MDIDRRALIGGVALSASFLAACQKSANSAREAELPQSPAVSDDEITGALRAYVE